jgi:peroxiredoxin
MQQVVDLQSDEEFKKLGVELLSLSPDSLDDWRSGADEYGIESPVLSDAGNRVAQAYGVMQWAMPSGEPGHTFVLVDEEGKIRWVRDYGAPQNGGFMYLPPEEILKELADLL